MLSIRVTSQHPFRSCWLICWPNKHKPMLINKNVSRNLIKWFLGEFSYFFSDRILQFTILTENYNLMIAQLKRYLVTFPVLAISLFFVLNFIAAYLYPGCTKEVINYQSDHYSFTHNFLSGLGSMQTNTDNVNKTIERLDNTPSMLLFNTSLVIIGISVLMFYLFFLRVKLLKDMVKMMLEI